MTTSSATMLLKLQAIDIEIVRAHKRLDDLPAKHAILEVRAKLKEVGTLKTKVAVLTRKLESELRARQDEIVMLNDKIEVEQAKIMGTTDHRQITSLTREMDGLKRRVDKLDMESLQYMERIEKANDQLATVEGHEQKLKDKDAVLVEEYRAAGSALQKEITQLEAVRAKLAASLPAELVEHYEAVRNSKSGVGVGRLEGDACSACRMTLPAERVHELHAGPEIGVCPQCRRLIVVREDGDR